MKYVLAQTRRGWNFLKHSVQCNKLDCQNLQQQQGSCVELWSTCRHNLRHLDAANSYRHNVHTCEKCWLLATHRIINNRPAATNISSYANTAQHNNNNNAITHTFVPVAVESMGPLGHEASEFLNDLGWRLSLTTDNARETSHLFQRVSVLIQRYNAVAFWGSFIEIDDNVSG